jgi:hypothetical protein
MKLGAIFFAIFSSSDQTIFPAIFPFRFPCQQLVNTNERIQFV